MIDVRQLRELVIRPSLPPGLYSMAAEELLVGTVAVESKGGTYIKQVKGPALGIFQMEPATFNDTWKYIKDSKFYTVIMAICNFKDDPVAVDMVSNLELATLVARMKYYRDPHPLPQYDDIDGLWYYYKRCWNTYLGDTNKEEFMQSYKSYCKG
jgi:hypothetical protein